MRDHAPMCDEALWTETSRCVEAETGLHFGPPRWGDLRRGLALAARRLGLADAAACAARLTSHGLDAHGRAVLSESLAIGETYFFRDPALFETLAREVLGPLAAQRRGRTQHLRLWSAGCSTGEEAYTLAMLVAGLLPDWREWHVSILATDLHAGSLAKARAGLYGRWSFRGGMPAAARRFLRPAADGRHEVDPELRRLVHFAPLNFARDAYPCATTGTTAMDLVLCRNVLIYFGEQGAREVLQRLGRSLAVGGWLVTGSVELPAEPPAGLERARMGTVAALRRPMAQVQALPRPARSEPADCTEVAAPAGPSVRATTAVASAPAAPAVKAQAQALADAGELDAAERLCREAMERDGLDPQWPWLLASILREQGRTQEAVRCLQRTLYLQPDHLLARFTLGSLALREGSGAGRRHLSATLARLQQRPPDDIIEGSGGLSARDLQAAIVRMGGAS